MAVKLVTDSTCDLPREVVERWDITVLPCYVHFGDDVYKDGVDLVPDDFFRMLVSSSGLPTTAQPSVNDFLQVYRALTGQGHDVVSVHLSEKLSGTLNSATQAKKALESEQPDGPRIEIIDSRLTSAGLGLIALEAAQTAGSGGTWEQVVGQVQGSLVHTNCYFLLDTLEYLQKGGRIGKASAFLGSLLSIKPLLMIKDGEAHPVERLRTRRRGVERLVETARGLAPARHLAVVHSTTPGEAEALRELLRDLVPEGEVLMTRFGPAIGTYLGPGALGVSVMSSG